MPTMEYFLRGSLCNGNFVLPVLHILFCRHESKFVVCVLLSVVMG